MKQTCSECARGIPEGNFVIVSAADTLPFVRCMGGGTVAQGGLGCRSGAVRGGVRGGVPALPADAGAVGGGPGGLAAPGGMGGATPGAGGTCGATL